MKPSRPLALIVDRAPFAPPAGAAELAAALREDARELIAAVRLRTGADSPSDAGKLAAQASGGLVIIFADVPAVPPMAIEAAIHALGDCDAALGPCPDGSLYLLALRPDLDPALVEEILEIVFQPGTLGPLTDLLDDAELQATVLPPWFRLASATDLSFAECLARLSLMSEEGEDDFVADRLRVWFEEYAAEA